MGEKNAKYLITFANKGSISIEEEAVTDDGCMNLPLNRFDWHDDYDDEHANARFCVTSPITGEKIPITVFLAANGAIRKELKSMLLMVAAGRMTRGPDL